MNLFLFSKWKELHDEVSKYREILLKLKDFNDHLAKEKMAVAYQEKVKMKLQVCYLFLNIKSGPNLVFFALNLFNGTNWYIAYYLVAKHQ